MRLRTKYKMFRGFIAIALVSMIFEIAAPAVAYALTSGPTQPEVSSFEPFNTNQMVDMFSGNFTYNIPLFELPGPNGGYPFNLAYQSGIGMDQEASWVGLGWTLNAGAINRNMRGLPDDFNGDKVTKTFDMKPNRTITIGVGKDFEIFGGDTDNGSEASSSLNNPDNSSSGDASLGVAFYHNNYVGFGYNLSPSVSYLSKLGKNQYGGSLGFTFDSQNGNRLSASVSYTRRKDMKDGKRRSWSLTAGIGVHSRTGLDELSLGVGHKRTQLETHEKTGKDYRDLKRSISQGGNLIYNFDGSYPTGSTIKS